MFYIYCLLRLLIYQLISLVDHDSFSSSIEFSCLAMDGRACSENTTGLPLYVVASKSGPSLSLRSILLHNVP